MSKQKLAEDEAQDEAQTIITDLSTTATYRGNNADDKQQMVEAPESPYMTTSNEESLESNSNSSNSRKRRKRKSSQVMRLTPSENLNSNLKRQRTPSPHSNNNSCSPKQSPKNGVEFQPFGMKEQKTHELPLENGRAATPPVAAATENSNSSSLYNDTDNPKTKKQRQALLQRNLTEQQQLQRHQQEPSQETPAVAVPTKEATIESKLPPPSPQSNSSSSSSSSSSAGTHSSRSSRASQDAPQRKEQDREQEPQLESNNTAITDTPASPALVEQGDIDARPAVSVHDDEDEVQSPPEKQSPPQAEAVATATPTTEPCHFNEVEDKLEQMFAGIEDEPQSRSNATAAEHDLSVQLAKTKAGVDEKPVVTTPTPTTTPELRPMATKAAMKSTLPSPIHSPAKISEVKEIKEETPSSSPVKVLPRPTPTRCMPQRRLSMGMDPSLLRFTIEEQVKTKKTAAKKKQMPQIEAEIETVHLDSDDEKPSTSAAAAAALAARQLSEAAVNKTITPKANNNSNKKKKKTTAAKGKKGDGED